MRTIFAALAASTFLAGAASAADIYPLDKATILSNSPFDFKVELGAVYPEADVAVTVNGKPYAEVFGKPAEYVAEEKGKEDKVLGSALILRGLTLAEAGTPGALSIAVDLIEPTGHETHVFGRLGRHQVVVAHSGRVMEAGRLFVTITAGGLHLFDRTSGRRIDTAERS